MDKPLSKGKIRQEIFLRREKLSEELVNSFSKIIERKVENLKEFKEAKTIMCYIAKGKEVNTMGIIQKSLALGKKVVAPKVNTSQQQIVLHEIRNPENDLSLGFKGILEPKSYMAVVKSLNKIDFAVLPGIAFDRNGRRIGFGKGFFDKLFMDKPIHSILCGIAFDFQILDNLPHSSHDIPMDVIVSERRIIRC